MSETNDSNPTDSFTFVDKRRVSTEPDFVESSAPDDTDGDPNTSTASETAESVAEPRASIYDIAAYATGMLITEGFQRLGLLADPTTGKAEMDLPSARVAIDCVAALVNVLDEPGSELPEPIRRELKRTLNDLRLNYIDRNRTS